MKYIVTAIYDEKTRQYLPPQVDYNEETAKRNFLYAISANKQLAFNKADLRLYQLGEWDSEIGELFPCSLVLIMDGKEVSDDEIR